MRLHFLTVLGCMAAASAIGAADRPNIVVILADDMGYGDVQALNPASAIPTPNLNGLAKSGLTFTDAHSPSAVCTPTRYGLLTGRYCWRSRLKRGVLGGYSEPLLESGRATVASMLHGAGYRTAAVGKWHLGMKLPMSGDGDTSKWDGDPGVDYEGVISDSPIHHGFDEYFGVSASLDMAPYVYIRDDRFTMVPTHQQPAIKFPHFVRKGPRSDDFVIDEVLDRLTQEAVRFIDRAAAKEAPYFLYMPLTGPHKPTIPHERFRGKTSLKEYGDFVHQVDWTVGEVLAAIEASGEADNTLVVFTSDNGSYMKRISEGDTDHVQDDSVQGYHPKNHKANGPLRGTKADIWEAGHRVPYFVRWPGVTRPGTACAEPIAHVDLFATFAEITDQPIGQDAAEDSASLLGLYRGDDGAERGAFVINHSVSGMFAIRDGRWKLVAGNGSGGREQPKGKPFEKPFALFDLDADLSEKQNVADQHPEVFARLLKTLTKLRNDGRSVSR